jgi:uncharacterized protein YfaS (alpha-2-macroglobulin family)
VGIANTIEGAKQPSAVTATLVLPPSLTLVGKAPAPITIAPGSEGTVHFRVRAGSTLGAAAVVVRAQSGAHQTQRRIELSLRPAIAARQDLRVGRADHRVVLEKLRPMFNERATRQLTASVSPLVAIDGLTAYLNDYPHLCTEQLISGAMPALVFGSHPELGKVSVDAHPGPRLDLIDVLRSRQNSDGGLGLWIATPDADSFATGYAALYLVESRERGNAVPDDMLQSLNGYLETLAADPSKHDLASLRERALAVYLLVRQGRTASNLLSAVHEQLKRDQPKVWQNDTAGLLLAASYQLLQQDKPARELAIKALARANGPAPKSLANYEFYYDAGIDQAWTLYLLNRHVPALAKQVTPAGLERLLDPLRNNSYNTLSSAMTVLALDAYASAHGGVALPTLQAAGKDGKARQIGAPVGLLTRGNFIGADNRLWVTPADATPVWYVLDQSGFDRVMPAATQNHGLEVLRDYLDADGKPVTSLNLGQEVTVRLRVRALDANERSDIAIVDLLPGGFEPVLQLPPAPAVVAAADASDSADSGDESEAGDDSEGDEEGEGEGDESSGDEAGSAAPPVPQLALPGSTFTPFHIEQREDRVVLYGDVGTGVTEFRYRVRANNAGVFVVPPIYAESMYVRSVYAQGGPAGTLQVIAPKP